MKVPFCAHCRNNRTFMQNGGGRVSGAGRGGG
jgi:hypothetical protein